MRAKRFLKKKMTDLINQIRYLSSHEWGRIDEAGILTVGIKKIQGEWVEGKRSRWKDDSADNASTKNSDQNN